MRTEEIIRLLQPLQLSGQDIVVHGSPAVFGLSDTTLRSCAKR
jgi:hypothetical protein